MNAILNPINNLELDERLISFHSLNSLIQHNSSPRGMMFSGHMSQPIVLEHGDESILQTGIENQFGDNTFSKKFDCDARIISLIDRYDGIDATSVNQTTEIIIMYENIDTGEIDYMSIPQNFSLHQQFGFKYRPNIELLNSMVVNTIIPKGTVVADSPNVRENSGYAYGKNAKVCLLSLPEVGEDGVVISESFKQANEYKVFEKKVVEYGIDKFPLNIYGTEDEYKPFPEIGERICDDSVLMVLRDYNSTLAPALISKKDVMEFDPIFDEAVYVKSPGGVISDIKVYHNPKFKKEVYTGTSDTVKKYVDGLVKFHNNIISVFERLQKEHYSRYKNWNIQTSEALNSLILDSYVIVNRDGKNLKKTYKKDELDIYRMEFTIEYTVTPVVGSKITDKSGAKGIVVAIWPDHMMAGNDVYMDPTSTISRMNIARLYEQYFNSSSRKVKDMLIAGLGNTDGMDRLEVVQSLNDDEVTRLFNIVVDYVKIFDTEQYLVYSQLTDIPDKREVLYDSIANEVFLYYKVSSPKKAYLICEDLKNSPYAPAIDPVDIYYEGGYKQTVDNVLSGPLYLFMLSKTADNFLSSSSAKTNHFELPIGVGKAHKDRLPWRNSPVKNFSETETRLYLSYVSRRGMAELKDRASSIKTHEHVYRNVLNSPIPTNIDKVVDREKIPFGGDSALKLVNSIFNCAGIAMEYVPEGLE